MPSHKLWRFSVTRAAMRLCLCVSVVCQSCVQMHVSLPCRFDTILLLVHHAVSFERNYIDHYILMINLTDLHWILAESLLRFKKSKCFFLTSTNNERWRRRKLIIDHVATEPIPVGVDETGLGVWKAVH